MEKQKQSFNLASMVYKTLLIGVIVICGILGVIGLVLPIIPGVLFLCIAAMLLAKLSSRFAYYLKQNAWVQKWQRRSRSFKTLDTMHRIKLSFWMTAKSLVDGAEHLWQKTQIKAK